MKKNVCVCGGMGVGGGGVGAYRKMLAIFGYLTKKIVQLKSFKMPRNT